MPESRVSSIYIALITTLVPAVVCLGLRFHPTRVNKVKLWWDDWFSIFALAAAVGYNAITFYIIPKGLGLHIPDLPIPQSEALMYQLLACEIQEHMYSLSIGSAQLSLLCLYWRLFGETRRSRILILIVTSIVVTWVLVRCFPPKHYWDKSIEGTCTIDPAKYIIGSVVTHMVIDLVLVALPAMYIYSLHMPVVQKAAITAMFCFGILLCLGSIWTLYFSTHYDSYAADVMWNCVPVVTWSGVELHLSLIACCLPVLKFVIAGLGGWFKSHFDTARGSVFTGNASQRLDSSNRGEIKADSESTDEMTAKAVDTSRHSNNGIYTAREDTETYVVSNGSNRQQPDCERSSDEGIKVQYEVNLGFSERKPKQG